MVGTAISNLRTSLLWIALLSLLAVITLGLFGGRILNKAVQREQQQLEKRVESRTSEISILQTLSGLLNACSTFQEAGDVLNRVIPTLLPGMKGSVSIIKSSRNRLDKITEWGETWPGLDKFLPTDCWAAPTCLHKPWPQRILQSLGGFSPARANPLHTLTGTGRNHRGAVSYHGR